MSAPIRRTCSACCARTAGDQAAAAELTMPVMNSRRLIAPAEASDRSIEAIQLRADKGSSMSAKADICSAKRHVRFTPKSRHVRCTRRCPLCANSGHQPSFTF